MILFIYWLWLCIKLQPRWMMDTGCILEASLFIDPLKYAQLLMLLKRWIKDWRTLMTISFGLEIFFLRTIIEEWQGKPFDHWSVSVWPTFMNHWLTCVNGFGVFCIPVICTLQDKFWLMALTRQGQGESQLTTLASLTHFLLITVGWPVRWPPTWLLINYSLGKKLQN